MTTEPSAATAQGNRILAVAAGLVTVTAIVIAFAAEYLELPWRWLRQGVELLLLCRVGRISRPRTLMARTKFDGQTIEIIGRNWLISELYRSGIEVARPERDHGVDLIAFIDLDQSGRFVGRPIQLKASN